MTCENIQPTWDDGVPVCTEGDCCQYDGKRCYAMGFRPDRICEPAVMRMSTELLVARQSIDAWKNASGLERGGDPDGVTPAAMHQYWEEQERQLAMCRGALRGLLAMVDETIYSTDSDREDRVNGACVIGLARELVEAAPTPAASNPRVNRSINSSSSEDDGPRAWFIHPRQDHHGDGPCLACEPDVDEDGS